MTGSGGQYRNLEQVILYKRSGDHSDKSVDARALFNVVHDLVMNSMIALLQNYHASAFYSYCKIR